MTTPGRSAATRPPNVPGSSSTPDGEWTSSLTGTFRWITPSGRTCTTEPARYPI